MTTSGYLDVNYNLAGLIRAPVDIDSGTGFSAKIETAAVALACRCFSVPPELAAPSGTER